MAKGYQNAKVTDIVAAARVGRNVFYQYFTGKQEAFLEADAMQCGWCTPGMILGAVGLLQHTPHPTDAEIVSNMNGHICRCGTYSRVVQAIQAAARKGVRA